MRDVKFRFYMTHKGTTHLIQESCQLDFFIDRDGDIHEHNTGFHDTSLVEVSNVIAVQYTGLRDKNGVEIYEGDILKDEYNSLTKVEWWDCGAWGQEPIPYADYMDYWQYATNHDDITIKEVVGNIYENKELLND